MNERAIFWPDIQAVLDAPTDVFSDGTDKFNRPKWKIKGEAPDSGEIEIVCAVEIVKNETNQTDQTDSEFITLYWED